MSDLVFANVHKVFPGGVVAVDDFSLTIPSPTMAVLVGPSGCGKSTLLRMVAGLEAPTRGEIHLGDERLDVLEARRRDIAMVFQSYALYPHMTVAQNLSFGLRLRKVPRKTIHEKVRDVARTLEIDGLLERKPGALSGGQRQRVALGRAIIREPRVFLFDEPLSNLDARLRTEMRATIKKLYRRLRTTSIYVTHDQVEAMTIGEQLVVMDGGRIQQVGTPESCYRRPANRFVASFLGSPAMNFIEGAYDREERALVLDGGERVPLPDSVSQRLLSYAERSLVMGVRPEDARPAPTRADDCVRLQGRMVLEEPLGHETLTHVSVAGVELVARGKDAFGGGADGHTSVYVEGGRVHLFSRREGTRVGTGAAGDGTTG
jgi:multiple sugar transport system ATP-binding protein